LKIKLIYLLVFPFINISIGYGQGKIDYEAEMKVLRQKITNQFIAFKIGDTIRIPYGTSFKYDGTERTTLNVYTAFSNNEKYDCVINGVIVEKNRKREKGFKSKGYNLIYKVLTITRCGSYPIVYDGKEVMIGQLITHNMRYFKVLD